jgi:hypothetical protein
VAIVDPAALILGGHVDVSARLSCARRGWPGARASSAWPRWSGILRRHAASAVAALLLAVPAVTAIGSAVALGEALHPASLLGMLVAMAGIWTVLRRETPAPVRAGFRRDVGSRLQPVCPPTGPAKGTA